MAMTYLDVLTKTLQMLQDTAGATYDKTTEVAYWIEESLKEIATYDPHIVDVIFKIESRTGTDVTGTASSLTDLVKLQFVAADATNEKVVHNIEDNTWAVVLANSSTSVNTLSADIMDANEDYKIYNKRCYNEKQIYIGDVTDYLWVDSVEYPLGTKRNWKIYDDVLEIMVDFVADSDSTLDPPNNIDVLVRFAKPHRLCQLTTLTGACTAVEPVGETTLAIKSFGTTEIVEIGDEFHIANQRSLYTVTTGVTLSGGAGNIVVYPGMEVATVVDDAIVFTKSTLKPQHEDLFCHLVAARAVLSDNINFINAIPKGGANVWSDYQVWAERKLAEVMSKLNRISKPKTKRQYSTG